MPQCLKSFLGNFNIVVSKNSLRILCQGSNGLTLFIPSLAKTANSYKTDKSKVNLEHQKAVFLFVGRCLLKELGGIILKLLPPSGGNINAFVGNYLAHKLDSLSLNRDGGTSPHT